jgi:NitT/TauT family transport system substrate-binding protein
MRFLQMQSNANQVSAVVGGQVDIAPIQVTYVMPAIQRGDAKLLAWVGDETPWQLGALFTPTRIADQRRDTVERFLRAYRKGARLYHDAFTGPDEKPKEGPTAPDMLAIIGKAIDQPADLLRLGLGYIEPDARIDEKDVLHQIAWYQSQGLIKGPVDGAAILDQRYVVDLP